MRYVRFPDLKARYGIPYSRVHLDRLEKQGKFPARRKLGPNCVAWLEAEIEAWCGDRPAAFYSAGAKAA